MRHADIMPSRTRMNGITGTMYVRKRITEVRGLESGRIETLLTRGGTGEGGDEVQ